MVVQIYNIIAVTLIIALYDTMKSNIWIRDDNDIFVFSLLYIVILISYFSISSCFNIRKNMTWQINRVKIWKATLNDNCIHVLWSNLLAKGNF